MVLENLQKALVAHDSNVIHLLLEHLLLDIGYQSEHVESAAAAIRALQHPVDRVFCSYSIASSQPDAIDQAVRHQEDARGQSIPVIVLTSSPERANSFFWLGPVLLFPVDEDQCRQPAPIDWDQLSSNVGDNTALGLDFLSQLHEDSRKLVSEIRQLLEANDRTRFASSVNRLARGPLSYCGEYARSLGTWANDQRDTEDPIVARRISRAFERTWSLIAPELCEAIARAKSHAEDANRSQAEASGTPVGRGDVFTRLATLKHLLDQELITQQDYDSRKQSILAEL